MHRRACTNALTSSLAARLHIQGTMYEGIDSDQNVGQLALLDTSVQTLMAAFRVKYVLSGHSKIGNTKILMTNGSLMKVESIAECSLWSILQYY